MHTFLKEVYRLLLRHKSKRARLTHTEETSGAAVAYRQVEKRAARGIVLLVVAAAVETEDVTEIRR